MKTTPLEFIAPLLAAVLLSGCGEAKKPPTSSGPPPAKVENKVKESELTTLTLTEEAEKRLGIETAVAVLKPTGRVREIHGELQAPPGVTLTVTAPLTGVVTASGAPLPAPGDRVKQGQVFMQLTPLLAPVRDLKVTYEADLAAAKARYDAAVPQLKRARQLVEDGAGSKRNVEAAEQELAQSKAGLDAAQARLERLKSNPLDADVAVRVESPSTGIVRQVSAAAGQQVAAGAPLVVVESLERLWVRVPVYAGELRQVNRGAPVSVGDLGQGAGRTRTAKPVAAPPAADPLALTVDLFYEIANEDGTLSPGEKVMVTLPLLGEQQALTAPASAILYDSDGGTWVYVTSKPHVYRRQRVEVIRVQNRDVILGRGPAPGAKVVTAGAAELFGTEFGAGK